MATIAVSEAPKRPAPWVESARVWIFKTFFTNLCGATFPDWWDALRLNRFAIDLPYWPRAAITTAGSVLNSLYRLREDRGFGDRLEGVAIKPPLFILGHWRSGTTLLHNLLARDDRFAYPNLYQVFFPHTFLCTEDVRTGLATSLIPSTRVFDNVAQGLQMPNEDEFATCAASLHSPYMMWSFPRSGAHYERYLTFRGVPAEEVERWRSAFTLFLKKLTLKHNLPMVLKSPPHTCRIKLLLEMFPDARFVHIRRDPYTVFQSTRHLNDVLTRSLQFQRTDPSDIDGAVIRRYKIMYDTYFEEKGLIPESRLQEVAFEDLERDPIGQIRQVYETLRLEGFETVSPRLEEYVAGLANYKKNEYPNLPDALRRQIRQAWRQSFEEWKYPD